MLKATGVLLLLVLVTLSAIACSGGDETYDVILKEIGPKKILVIPVVRTFRADLGLKEAKELVDSAPVKVLEAVPLNKAQEAERALEEVDAIAEIVRH